MSQFIQKEEALLRRLRETNYDLFDGDVDMAHKMLEDRLTIFPQYANVIIREQVMMPIWRNRCEPEEFRQNCMDIDRQRKHTHDAAIDSVNILNRMSKALGLEPYADVDTNDRYAVADFIGNFVNEVYNDGIKGGIDTAVKEKTADYDTKKVGERLRRLDADIARAGIQTSKASEPSYEP